MFQALLVVTMLFAPPEVSRPTPDNFNPSKLPMLAEIRQAEKPSQPVAPAAPLPLDTSPQATEAIINAPVSEVWKVFSTPEGFKAFGVAQCEMDFRVGGLIRSHYAPPPKGVLGDDGTIQQRILAFDPERMFAFRIEKPPANFPFPNAWKETWTVATLTDLGNGKTHLRLAGNGYTADEESQKMRAFFKAGNAWSVKKLQSHFDATAKAAPAASAHATDPLAPIEIEAIIAAPRAEVYKAYTTSEGWKDFFGTETSIEARPGGPFEIYFGADQPKGQRGSEGCLVLSLIPNEMFSYTWNAPPKFAHARAERTWVVLRFDEVGPARTRVRVSHMGFTENATKFPDHAEEWKTVRGYFANAWPMVLGELKKHWVKE